MNVFPILFGIWFLAAGMTGNGSSAFSFLKGEQGFIIWALALAALWAFKDKLPGSGPAMFTGLVVLMFLINALQNPGFMSQIQQAQGLLQTGGNTNG